MNAIPKRIKGWLESSPVFGPRPSIEELLAQQEDARQRRLIEANQARIDRLRPFAKHMLLVTDFGSFGQREHLARVTQKIVESQIFDDDRPVGVSAHIMANRSRDGQIWQQNTAADLTIGLRSQGLNVYPNVRFYFPYERDEGDWLETLVTAPEETAEFADREPTAIGQIAVVGELEVAKVGIRVLSDLSFGNGALYQLMNVGEGSQIMPEWQLLSAPQQIPHHDL